MFNKKEWVIKNLKSGFDSHQFTAEYVMTISMQYSMAGVLDDNDLAELADYTTPVSEDVVIHNETESTDDEQTDAEVMEEGAEYGQADTEVTESE